MTTTNGQPNSESNAWPNPKKVGQLFAASIFGLMLSGHFAFLGNAYLDKGPSFLGIWFGVLSIAFGIVSIIGIVTSIVTYLERE